MDWTQYFSQNDEAVALLRALIWKNDPFQSSILNNSHKNPGPKYVQILSTTSYAAPKWPRAQL